MQTAIHPEYSPAVIKTKETVAPIPWFIFSALIATTSIVIGLRWDISWHMSIGRDGLFSPPHLAIYLGGILAGIGGAYQLFKTTFAGSTTEKSRSVWFWGFRSPLGALFSIWGAIAMLTSAPFDDWWHNAYGLDVEILTPPHTVLLLGIIMVQMGSVITLLTYQNQQESEVGLSDSRKRNVRMMYVFTIGMLLSVISIMIWEYTSRQEMHLPSYYHFSGIFLTMFLAAAGRASELKWPITWAAIWYMTVSLAVNWILPLFPAEPLLGPIYTQVTHFVALKFPFLLIIPAIAMDYVMKNVKVNDWLMSLFAGLSFFIVFFATQWIFGEFLMSEAARNWIFHQDSSAYFNSPNWRWRYQFFPYRGTTGEFIVEMLIAASYTVLMARIGLWWGNWMKKVKR